MKEIGASLGILLVFVMYAAAIWMDKKSFEFLFRWRKRSTSHQHNLKRMLFLALRDTPIFNL